MSLGVALTASFLSAVAPSALVTEIVSDFTRELCLRDTDRYEGAHQIVPESWEVTRTREERNIDFAVDGPVPLHDTFERSWHGRVGGATIRLLARRSDYRDPARRDYSYAMFSIYPASLLDLAAYQTRLGITLRPRYLGTDRGGREGRVSQVSGEVLIDGRPIDRPVQHYAIIAPESVEPIEIRARHILDEEFPEQLFSLSCATRL